MYIQILASKTENLRKAEDSTSIAIPNSNTHHLYGWGLPQEFTLELLHNEAEWGQKFLAELDKPAPITPCSKRQFRYLSGIASKKHFHLLREVGAVDLYVDLIVSNRTQAIEVSSANS
jgi:hypothetical protein